MSRVLLDQSGTGVEYVPSEQTHVLAITIEFRYFSFLLKAEC